jgi:hypothetical protein
MPTPTMTRRLDYGTSPPFIPTASLRTKLLMNPQIYHLRREDSRLQRGACDTGHMVSQRRYGLLMEPVSNMPIIDRTDVLILERPGAMRSFQNGWPKPRQRHPRELCDTRTYNTPMLADKTTGTLSPRQDNQLSVGQGPASDHESPQTQAVSPSLSQRMKLKWTHSNRKGRILHGPPRRRRSRPKGL